MTIIEQIARALARKHYSDRFRPVEGQEAIVEQNVNGNWPIFTADAAVAMEAAGEAIIERLDEKRDACLEMAETKGSESALNGAMKLEYAIEQVREIVKKEMKDG